MSSLNTLLNLKPATHWMDASPIGNGHIGAMVYGKLTKETIMHNDERWYHVGGIKKMPRLSKKLSKVRRLIDENNCEKADMTFPNTVIKNWALKPFSYGFNGRKSFICGIDMIIEDCCEGAFSNYKRETDMSKGETVISWNDSGTERSRSTFVSRKDNIVATRILSNKDLSVKLYWGRHSPDDFNQSRADDKFLKTKSEYTQNIGTISCESKNANYGGVLRVVTNGKVITDKDGIRITNTKEILILSTLFWNGKENAGKEKENAASAVNSINFTYGELLSRHISQHQKIYNSVDFSICTNENHLSNEELLIKSYKDEPPKQLIEKMFKFGRYLLICSSPQTGLPANLQGIWNGDYAPAWDCAFFNNENIQLCYAVAMQGGMTELMLPFFDLYESLMDDFKENARRVFGADGIFLPLYNNPYCGLSNNLQPHCIYWSGGGAWIASFFYDYYEFTGDVEFLKERAVPFIEEVFKFYKSFAVIENGKIKIYPSISPENTSNGYFTTINSTMDIALLKEICRNLIKSYEILGENEKIKDIKDFLNMAPDYRINQDGALAEWIDDKFNDNYTHRHLSHLYPVFPSTEINKTESPVLFKSAQVATEKRLVVGLKDQSGWSLAHSANIYARLGDGENALRSLKYLAKILTGENLLTYHNDWHKVGISEFCDFIDRAPYQLDANCGFSSGIIEMLVFSKPELINILPALPKEWEKGKIAGVNLRGNGKISIEWDMTVGEISANIEFENETEVLINLPFRASEIKVDDRVIERDTDNIELTIKAIHMMVKI